MPQRSASVQFTTIRKNPETVSADTLVVGLHAEGRSAKTAGDWDRLLHQPLKSWLRNRGFEARPGQMLSGFAPPGGRAQEVLVVGLGKPEKLTRSRFRGILGSVMDRLVRSGSRSVVNTLTALPLEGLPAAWRIRQAVEATHYARYRFTECRGAGGSTSGLPRLDKVHLCLGADAGPDAGIRQAIRDGEAIAHGVRLCRDLGNRPPNLATPRHLAAEARKLAAQDPRFRLRVLTEKEMKTLGMNALLAVAQGSSEPPRLIVLEYLGSRRKAPIALVGKGITFDSGGLSIKPAAAMDEMKFDMCGAASVLGTLKTVSELNLPLHVVGVIAAAENMPDGRAIKPGGIVRSLSGQTIEILNTDAEGRLVLCDALTYVQKNYRPRILLDAATLTGACVVALGHHPSGLFSNHDGLVRDFEKAAQEAVDPVWRMPLWDDYQDALASNFADFANIGGRDAGAITAACFLWRFVGQVPWIHLDIAGTAWKTGAQKGATGRPVPLFTQYLLDRARAGD
jgi:leucyl aminopeptidase